MIRLERTTSSNPEFIELVVQLDADLAIKDGAEHSFYDQFNKIDKINHVVMAYDGYVPVGCGAIKKYDRISMEIKRMYTLPEYRGRGIGSDILKELEKWTGELSYEKCILETGIRQPDAIALYKKSGYQLIPNYGQYIDASDSRCFEKTITKI